MDASKRYLITAINTASWCMAKNMHRYFLEIVAVPTSKLSEGATNVSDCGIIMFETMLMKTGLNLTQTNGPKSDAQPHRFEVCIQNLLDRPRCIHSDAESWNLEVTFNYTENFEEPRFLHLIVLSVNHKSGGG